ncbi:MAG: HNH endonuclease signature motif containing protein [Acidiferrobacteraceae bacterium]
MTVELVRDNGPAAEYPLANDARIAEYRAARLDASRGLGAQPGAHKRYRDAIPHYLAALAEQTPDDSPARPHLMAALIYNGSLPAGAVLAAFRATPAEADWVAGREPVYEPEPVDQVEALKAMPYRSYLRTSHWSRVRDAALKRAEYRCALCNAGAPLQVHHRTYARRGAERPYDVIVLCASCHDTFHKKLSRRLWSVK